MMMYEGRKYRLLCVMKGIMYALREIMYACVVEGLRVDEVLASKRP